MKQSLDELTGKSATTEAFNPLKRESSFTQEESKDATWGIGEPRGTVVFKYWVFAYVHMNKNRVQEKPTWLAEAPGALVPDQGWFSHRGQRPGPAPHRNSRNVRCGVREAGASPGVGFPSAPACWTALFCRCLGEAASDVLFSFAIPLDSCLTANTDNVFANHNGRTGRFYKFTLTKRWDD